MHWQCEGQGFNPPRVCRWRQAGGTLGSMPSFDEETVARQLAKAEEVADYLEKFELKVSTSKFVGIFHHGTWVRHPRVLRAYTALARTPYIQEADAIGRLLAELVINAAWIRTDERRAKAWYEDGQASARKFVVALEAFHAPLPAGVVAHVERLKREMPVARPKGDDALPPLEQRAATKLPDDDEEKLSLPVVYDTIYRRQSAVVHVTNQAQAALLLDTFAVEAAIQDVLLASAALIRAQALALDVPELEAYGQRFLEWVAIAPQSEKVDDGA